MTRIPAWATSAGITQADRELASRDASLGVGHVWTEVGCPAYRTLKPADCTCRGTITPTMGWQSCRYVFDGNDAEDGDYYRCIVHDCLTLGHDVSCEKAGDDQ